MNKDLIETLDKRIRYMKPHEKSDPAVHGGVLVSKAKVLEEIRKLRSISVRELKEYLDCLPDGMEVTVQLDDGRRMNVYSIHDAEMHITEREIGKA